MTSNFLKDDAIFGSIDLDDEYITDAWLVEQFVGSTLFSWGQNSNGNLGAGDVVHRSSPIQIGALANWKQICPTPYSSQVWNLGVKNDGTAWSIGGNGLNGVLGQGASLTQSSPIQIGLLTNWKQIAAGQNHSAAVKTDGTLWAWGLNTTGGLGTVTDIVHRSSPVQIGSLTTWRQVALGINQTSAIKFDGTLWSCGDNSNGSLGDGTVVNKSSMIQVGSATNWKLVSCGRYATAAITTDGKLWTWGRNTEGNLGLGIVANRSAPVQVGLMTNWKQVSISYNTMAIKTDGTLWAWGNNGNGQLGDGTVANKSSPVQVGLLTNWKYVNAAQAAVGAVKTDGTVWMWGVNTNGGLGQRDLVHRSSPVQVGSLTNWKYISVGFVSTSAVTFAEIT